MRVSEKQLRRIVREAHYMTDDDLIRESILLQEFLGSILKAVTAPFRGLMSIYKKGLLNTIGKKGQVILRNAFGTQKDVDRKLALQTTAELAAQLEDMTSAEAFAEISSYADNVKKEVEDLMDTQVFPEFGRIDQETGPQKDAADRDFKKSVNEIIQKCGPLVSAGAKFRGAVKALVKSGSLGDVNVPENPIDLSFPLSYVSSLKVLGALVKSKSPEGSGTSSLDEMIEACDAFVKKKTPSLKRLTDRVEGDESEDRRYNEAATRIVVYGNVLNERKRTRGRVI